MDFDTNNMCLTYLITWFTSMYLEVHEFQQIITSVEQWAYQNRITLLSVGTKLCLTL